MRWFGIFALFALKALAQEDVEDTFTIFIDLDDFHVTQLDNHEFLHRESIGEHDNVLLQLSEEEVKHFLDRHDTHDCQHPSELHEVVSFLEERMYEQESIDDAIQSNYNQDNAVWDTMGLKSVNPAAAGPFPMGITANNIQSQNIKSAATTPSQPTVQAQLQPLAQDQTPQLLTLTIAADEQEAVSRFLDAYHAWKYLNHAVEGLGEPAAPAAATTPTATDTSHALASAEVKANPHPIMSFFESMMDENDKRLFGMFSNPNRAAMTANALGNMDNIIANAVDEAIRTAPAPSTALSEDTLAVPEVNDAEEAQVQAPKRHHHHHKKKKSAQKSEEVEAASATATATTTAGTAAVTAPAVAPAPAPEPVHATAASSDGFSPEERMALKSLLHDVIAKKKETAAKSEAPKTEAEAKKDMVDVSKTEAVKETKVASASAIDTTSHIEKAPTASEIIPESVYSQQLVDFNEKPKPLSHHVPKRILIPRMEEPGPVIGGSSRPVHIQLPPIGYDAPLPPQSTRPAPPSLTKNANTNAAATATSKDQPSVKPAALAQVNDEALTAPEVVIF